MGRKPGRGRQAARTDGGTVRLGGGDGLIEPVAVLNGADRAALDRLRGTENLIRDRVVEMRRIRAGDVRRNPKNFRTHPKVQADVQMALLRRVGFAGALLAYQPADGGGLMLIDGHLRAELTPDDVVPVLVLDVSDAEAEQILASYDPIGSMAGHDVDLLESLLAGPAVASLNDDAPALLDALQKLLGDPGDPEPPAEFPVADESSVQTDHQCPSCGYRWSGGGHIGRDDQAGGNQAAGDPAGYPVEDGPQYRE